MRNKGIVLTLAVVLAVLVGAQATWASTQATFYQWFSNLGSSLNRPAGVASDNSNLLFVADTANNRVVAFNSSNNNQLAAVTVSSPTGIAVISAGSNATTVYVADGNSRIQKVTLNKSGNNYSFGSPQGVFISSGLSGPAGLAVDKNGNVYVADTGNNAIKKFSSSGGNPTASWTGFSGPQSIVAYDSGNTHYLYVADTGNNCIKKFDGTNWTTFTTGGQNPLSAPAGVAVDNTGYVYVADTGNSRVQKYDINGVWQCMWGGPGTGNCQFTNGPKGIAVPNKVFVCDPGNNRVQEFGTYTATADAGGTQSISNVFNLQTGAETLVKLNGTNSSGSFTPQGGGTTSQIVSYSWELVSISPQNNDPNLTVTLTGPNTSQPTFNAPPVPYNYSLTFALTVTFTTGTVKDTCIVNVTLDDQPPTAKTGGDQTVSETSGAPGYTPTQVTLDGSQSTAYSTAAIASYLWEQKGGTSVTLSDPTAVKPTFTAPNVGRTGEALTYQLTVTDTMGLKSTSPQCVVNVQFVDQGPVANAGGSQTVNDRDTNGNPTLVTLNGTATYDPALSASDLTYTWSQILTGDHASDPQVTLNPVSPGVCSFLAPKVTGPDVTLAFLLTVYDGYNTATSQCTVTVHCTNQPPTARISAPTEVKERDKVTLDGSGSTDPDDGIASYSWTKISGPPVTLSDATAMSPTFTAPDVSRSQGQVTLTFQLTVTDFGGLKSTSQPFEVKVDFVNTPPQATITCDNITTSTQDWGNSSNQLNGTASDADGDAIRYRWVADGSIYLCDWTAVGSDGTTPLSLTNVPRLATGTHTVTLQVTDGDVYTTTDPMNLTVNLTAPTVNITGGSGDYSVNHTTQPTFPVTLKATVMDFDGVPLTYTWTDNFNNNKKDLCGTQTINTTPEVTIDFSDTIKGLAVGTHTLTLTVSDGPNTVTKDMTVTIIMDSVVPTANPTVSQGILWPPNKAMVPIVIQTNASNSNSDPVQIINPQVACSDNGKPYGKPGVDWTDPVTSQDGQTITLNLCADRLGTGTGRTYTISFTAYNPKSDLPSLKPYSVTVTVPHDQGKK